MIESANATQPKTDESENNFLKRYQQYCIKQEEDGAYCVKFLGNGIIPLPPIYTIYKNKTHDLASKLSHNPELLHLYSRIITEQEQRGFI